MENDESNITVVEIRDIQNLSQLADDINSFLDNPLVHGNPYHYPDYIESVVKFDASIETWKVLVLKDSGEIVSIIPIYIRYKKFPIKFALFSLFSFNINMLSFFGDSFSYRSDYSLPVIHNILNEQLKSISHFDLGIINALPADSLLLSDFQGKKNGVVFKPLSKNHEVVRCIKFPETWGEYLSSMKRKRRYNLKRNIKILKDHCNDDVVVKCYESDDDVGLFLSEMDEIYKNTWQSSTFGCQSRLTDLEINQNKSLAKMGCFKSYILFASQTPIAFIRGYLFKGKYYYEEIGYKQSMAKYNPGSVLNFLMLEQLMSGGSAAKELNFGYGENVYKQVFSNEEYKATNAYLFRKGSKGNIIFRIQQLIDHLYVAVRKIIVKLKLEVIIRRMLRK